MNWEVRIPQRVNKKLNRFPGKDRQRILATLREFDIDPWRGDIVKIKDENNLWRRRVGNYRIFYSVDAIFKAVEIKEIQRRTTGTY